MIWLQKQRVKPHNNGWHIFWPCIQPERLADPVTFANIGTWMLPPVLLHLPPPNFSAPTFTYHRPAFELVTGERLLGTWPSPCRTSSTGCSGKFASSYFPPPMASFTDTLLRDFLTGNYSDLRIIDRNDTVYNVHKVVLCHQSPWFEEAVREVRVQSAGRKMGSPAVLTRATDGRRKHIPPPQR